MTINAERKDSAEGEPFRGSRLEAIKCELIGITDIKQPLKKGPVRKTSEEEQVQMWGDCGESRVKLNHQPQNILTETQIMDQ